MRYRTIHGNAKHSRQRRHDRRQTRQECGRADRAEAMVHRAREEREHRSERRAQRTIARHRASGDRAVCDDEVRERRREDEVHARAERHRRDDRRDPVHVLVRRERQPEQPDGCEDPADLPYNEPRLGGRVPVVLFCLLPVEPAVDR